MAVERKRTPGRARAGIAAAVLVVGIVPFMVQAPADAGAAVEGTEGSRIGVDDLCAAEIPQYFEGGAAGAQAEAFVDIDGSSDPDIVTVPGAYGGQAVKFDPGDDDDPPDAMEVPIALPSTGTYDLYVRGRGFGATSNSVYVAPSPVSGDLVDVHFSGDGKFEWRPVSRFTISQREAAAATSIRFIERERNVEIDAVALLPVGANQHADEPFVHTQPDGARMLMFGAEDRVSLGDPDGDGIVFERANAEVAQGQTVLRAPRNPELASREAEAVYRVRFSSPGIYQLHLRGRGAGLGADSFNAPLGFDRAPTTEVHLHETGRFVWATDARLSSFTVAPSDVGKILTLRVGAREAGAELDAIALVQADESADGALLDTRLGLYEAEDAQRNGLGIGGLDVAAASGTGWVDGFDEIGDSLTLPWVTLDASNRLHIRYSLDRRRPRQASVYVDGVDVATAVFFDTGGWDRHASTFVYVPHGGSIAIRIDADDHVANFGDVGAAIDRVSTDQDARVCFVVDAADLGSALDDARPGDTFVLANQHTRARISISRSGTPTQPITIRAETAGFVDLGPGSGKRVHLKGDHLVVDGLSYRFSTDQGEGRDDPVIAVDDGSTNNRVTNVSITHFNPGGDADSRLDWIQVGGTNHRIDHNRFEMKTTIGKTVNIDHPPGSGRVYHVIDHNFFGESPYGKQECLRDGIDDGCANGWEPISIGGSKNFENPAAVAVRYNLFDGSDSEFEVITSKAGENDIAFNTFRNLDYAHLTLRSGDDGRVIGNSFVNVANGMRVYGARHLIINNYFENVPGDAIAIGTGTVTWQEHGACIAESESCAYRACYFAATSLVIAHNSFTSTGTPIGEPTPNSCDDESGGEIELALPVSRILVVNNVVLQSPLDTAEPVGGFAGYCDRPLDQVFCFPNSNLVTGGAEVVAGTVRPGLDSAAVDGGVPFREVNDTTAELAPGFPTLPQTRDDVDGQPRVDGLPDLGADELGSGPITVGQLTRADVGPRWGLRIFPAGPVTDRPETESHPR